MSLLKQLIGNSPEKKLQKEIEGAEFKKQSLITPLQNDINGANNKVQRALNSIGELIYEKHLQNESVNYEQVKPELVEHYNNISEQKVLIAEREAKIKEFSDRYDEEISILKANLAAMTAAAAQPSTPNAAANNESGEKCPQCGNAYTPNEDAFCTGCGAKL